jgi:hypothetical protein
VVAQQSINAPSTYAPIFLIDNGPPPGTPPRLPSNGLLPAPNGTTLKSRPFDWKTELMDSYNFTVERQLSPSMILDVAYVGAKGTHLSWQYNYNSANPGPGSLDSRRPLYAKYGIESPDNYMCNCSDSNFNSLQIQIRKAYSKNITFTTNIVWQKNMSYDGSTTPQYRKDDYGPGAGSNAYSGSWSIGTMDRALTWNLTHTILLPYGTGQRWGANASKAAKAALGGWQFSGVTALASGLGLTPQWSDSSKLNADFGQRANVVSGCNWRNVPGGQNRNQWYNESCFADPGLYTFGDAGVGSMRGPGVANVDLALWKQFNFSSLLNRERTSIQIRAEAYNAFNFTNLSNPGWNVDQVSNEQITQLMPSYTMRRFEFGVHVEW